MVDDADYPDSVAIVVINDVMPFVGQIAHWRANSWEDRPRLRKLRKLLDRRLQPTVIAVGGIFAELRGTQGVDVGKIGARRAAEGDFSHAWRDFRA